MSRRINDFQIGLLVIVSLALLLALSYKVSKFSFVKVGYQLKVAFINASGVEKNAPVRLSGVEVGKVKDVQLTYGPEGTQVLLVLWLDKNAKVRQDSQALVTTLGLMGEKYVELTAGSAEAPFLPSNSTIVGREPFDTTKFLEKGEQIAENLDRTITDIRQLSNGVNELILVHRDDLDNLLKNLAVTSENIKAFSEDVKWHPWKLLRKGKSGKPKEKKKKQRE